MLPKLSIPRIIVIRGAIASLPTELVVPGACHLRLRKSLIPNQVSSIFKKFFLFLSRERYSSAHLCRRTRFFSELLCMAVSLILRYLMKWSRFMTVSARLSLIVTRGDSGGKALLMAYSARVDTWEALSMITFRSLRSQTILEIAHSFSNLA